MLTIYRHPKNDLQKFIIALNSSLETLKNNNTVYLIGDFNINLASTDDLDNAAASFDYNRRNLRDAPLNWQLRLV